MKHIIIFTTIVAFHSMCFSEASDKAKMCAACHGDKGLSNNPLWPNLAGQKNQYLVLQLKDFREGRRLNPMMNPIAKTLSDSDIDELANYFSSLNSEKSP